MRPGVGRKSDDRHAEMQRPRGRQGMLRPFRRLGRLGDEKIDHAVGVGRRAVGQVSHRCELDPGKGEKDIHPPSKERGQHRRIRHVDDNDDRQVRSQRGGQARRRIERRSQQKPGRDGVGRRDRTRFRRLLVEIAERRVLFRSDRLESCRLAPLFRRAPFAQFRVGTRVGLDGARDGRGSGRVREIRRNLPVFAAHGSPLSAAVDRRRRAP